jgi:hypothetical protein
MLGACGSGAKSGSGGSGGSSTSAAAWATAYCSTLATYETAATAEVQKFNATTPPDAQGLKDQEVAHIQAYLALIQPVLDGLNKGGSPDIPDGAGYVSGYVKAFTTLQTALNGELAKAKAIDVTESTDVFNSDLQGVSSAVNDAFTQLTSDWNGVDSGFTNPGDNPLVHAMNGDAHCVSFRNGQK